MSGQFTVCGNYVTPELPRSRWYNFGYTVDAVDETGSLAMAEVQAKAELSDPVEVDGRRMTLTVKAAAFAAVHPDTAARLPEFCQASFDEEMVENNARIEEEDFSGDTLPTFLICGTIENYNCGSHQMEGYGPWSALLGLQRYFQREGHQFYLAGLHPLVVPAYDFLVFADGVSETERMMALTAREFWGVTR